MKPRLIAAGIVLALAVGFACLPFHSAIPGFKGIGGGTLSCRAPIISSWNGGTTTSHLSTGVEYASSGQCGHDARIRLIVAGSVVAVAVVGAGVTLSRSRRGSSPRQSWL